MKPEGFHAEPEEID
jgi:hypothetical protein